MVCRHLCALWISAHKYMVDHNLERVYYQDRASNLAASQIPLVVALGGRSNIISCKWYKGPLKLGAQFDTVFTGVSHEKVGSSP